MWSTVKTADAGPAGDFGANPKAGSADGAVFMPAEQDAAIQAGANQGGFWYPSEKAKDVGELVDEYEDSVGHNSNYMLELSPDRSGALPAGDVAAYEALGLALRRCYLRGPDRMPPAANVSGTCGHSGIVNGTAVCELVLPPAATVVDRIRIAEDMATRNIRSYEVLAAAPTVSASVSTAETADVDDGAGDMSWVKVASGSSVGHCRIHRLIAPLPPKTQIKIRVLNATAPPVLKAFEAINVYGAGGCMAQPPPVPVPSPVFASNQASETSDE
jgi:hypothetical protein